MNRSLYALIVILVLCITACQKTSPVNIPLKQTATKDSNNVVIPAKSIFPYTDTFIGTETYNNSFCNGSYILNDTITKEFHITYADSAHMLFSGPLAVPSYYPWPKVTYVDSSFSILRKDLGTVDSSFYPQNRLSFIVKADSLIIILHQSSPCFCNIDNIFKGRKHK
jgi:hypothetical protein